MARHDVFLNERPASRKRFPYFLVVQSDLLDALSTTVIVPLGKAGVVEGKLAQTLTPELELDGERLVMYTPELSAMPSSLLRLRAGNLDAQHDTILRALDFLFSGI
ncbi:MAG: CcdB family protein [Xanthomonadales bacterium]|nr:CcdB family protein [Xanthomonadales bacterium]